MEISDENSIFTGRKVSNVSKGRETKSPTKTTKKKDTNDLSSTGDESEDGHNAIHHKDQDSDASFEIDTDEEIDTTEIEEEYWVDYKKEAQTKKNRCWNKTHKNMRWRLALRIATSPSER